MQNPEKLYELWKEGLTMPALSGTTDLQRAVGVEELRPQEFRRSYESEGGSHVLFYDNEN
ncbi:hypothetical protein ARMSODRAFT_966552 [Armillaria solidipes]|uniref:Uncharacterized protein n=1 Tax=Armillaria solidipes TaxID=1076256 RepID=A0A2H3BA42_9AGAR|nr:hypothetical protein ARMSODRAFT_966552 [Armillaria solidipes]